MRLYHATHKANLASIRRHGLSVNFAQCKGGAVWMCSEDRQAWAVLHAVSRHGGDVRDVIVLELEVEDEVVKKSAYNGLWYSRTTVGWTCCTSVFGFERFSRSPVE